MTVEYTPLQVIAQDNAEAFVFGLDTATEVVEQYQQVGKPLEPFSTEADSFYLATNRAARRASAEFGEAEFNVVGIAISIVLDEAYKRQGTTV